MRRLAKLGDNGRVRNELTKIPHAKMGKCERDFQNVVCASAGTLNLAAKMLDPNDLPGARGSSEAS